MTQEEYRDIIDKLASEGVEMHETIMFERILFQGSLDEEFMAQLKLRWYRTFVSLETMYLLIIEYCEEFKAKYYKEHEEGKSLGIKQFALQNIHGRACQIFLEILCLLKNGFADCAFARWRTLFELSVFAIFIKENNLEVAYAYIEQSKDGEREFQTGTEWAKKADCFVNKNDNVSFQKIFNSCKFPSDQKEFWQKQYRFSCKFVHASPQGTMKRLANSGVEHDYILVGRSPWGLHSPAEHAANSLYQVTAAFFSTFADNEVVVATTLLNKWIDVVCKHIYETVRDSFPDVPEAKEIADDYFEKRDV